MTRQRDRHPTPSTPPSTPLPQRHRVRQASTFAGALTPWSLQHKRGKLHGGAGQDGGGDGDHRAGHPPGRVWDDGPNDGPDNGPDDSDQDPRLSSFREDGSNRGCGLFGEAEEEDAAAVRWRSIDSLVPPSEALDMGNGQGALHRVLRAYSARTAATGTSTGGRAAAEQQLLVTAVRGAGHGPRPGCAAPRTLHLQRKDGSDRSFGLFGETEEKDAAAVRRRSSDSLSPPSEALGTDA